MVEKLKTLQDDAPTIVPSHGNSIGISTFLELNRLGFLAFMDKLWQQHGDIYRFNIGPQAMTVVASPEAIRQVSLQTKYFSKGQNYDLIRRYAGGRNLLTSVGDDWQWQRKLLAPQFTPTSVKRFADLMMEEAHAMFDKWDAQGDSPLLDMDLDMLSITANITLRSIFTKQGMSSFETIREDVTTLIAFLTKRQQAIVQVPLWFPNKSITNYKAAHKRLYDFFSEIIDERLQQPKETWVDDMVSRFLLATDQDGNSMSKQIVKNQGLTFFVAGHESSALTMTFALYEIARHPHVEAKIIEEIDSVTTGQYPTLDDMKQMPYVLQVIKETMRLYPPVPYYPRDVMEDTTLDGYQVKQGDSLLVFPYATHRHPDYWENPDQFDPERFTPEREKAQHSQAYIPFGSGKRICIGNHFALLECQILLSMIYSRYLPRIEDGYQMEIMAIGLIQLKNGLPIRLEKR